MEARSRSGHGDRGRGGGSGGRVGMTGNIQATGPGERGGPDRRVSGSEPPNQATGRVARSGGRTCGCKGMALPGGDAHEATVVTRRSGRAETGTRFVGIGNLYPKGPRRVRARFPHHTWQTDPLSPTIPGIDKTPLWRRAGAAVTVVSRPSHRRVTPRACGDSGPDLVRTVVLARAPRSAMAVPHRSSAASFTSWKDPTIAAPLICLPRQAGRCWRRGQSEVDERGSHDNPAAPVVITRRYRAAAPGDTTVTRR